MSDIAARMRALDPTYSFIVQAPAGSGKTELLTQRILSLLAFAVREPEEVLAITFTKKAAQEMRERVISALNLGFGERPETAYKQKTWELARAALKNSELRAWDILNQPQRLNILTIDALCARLVRQLPIVSEMGVMSEMSADPDALYELAAINTLSGLLQVQDSAAMILLKHADNRLDRVVDMVANMLSSREQWLPLVVAHQDKEAAHEVLTLHLNAVVTEVLEHAALALEPYLQDLAPLTAFAAEQGVSPALAPLSAFHADCVSDTDHLPIWRALAAWLLTREGELRKIVNKNDGFPAPTDAPNKELKALFKAQKESMKSLLDRLREDESAVTALQTLNLVPDSHFDEASWVVLSALLEILPQAAAMLMVEFDTAAELDFSAVAMGALRALGDSDTPSDLSLKLDDKIGHILVDEFQDTSFMQYELLLRLTAGWQEGDGRTLFLVGDPMQSIYRFRQAEVSLFMRVREQGLGTVSLTPLTLTLNFRSDPSVIRWINEAAAEFFPAQEQIHQGAVTYSPSTAGEDVNRGPGSGVYAHILESTAQEAAHVLDLVQKALVETQGSIAILVRARSHLSAITQVLSSSNIVYQAVELEPLMEKTVIQQLLVLTRALMHLADRTAWLSLLRSALCGLSLSDITRICDSPGICLLDNLKAAYQHRKLSAEGLRILERVLPILQQAWEQSQTQGFAVTVRAIWTALGGPATCVQFSALGDADQYFHLLAKHEVAGTVLDWTHFTARLAATYARASVADSRVQVMTIHKAKGLEFDVVILPGLSKGSGRGDNPVFVWDKIPTGQGEALLLAPIHPLYGEKSPLYQFIAKQRELKDACELSRVLYVALTRAKGRCYLSAVLNKDDEQAYRKPSKGSFAHRLWAQYERMGVTPVVNMSGQAGMHRPLQRLRPDWRATKTMSELPARWVDLDNRVDTAVFEKARVDERALGTVLHQALCDMANMSILEINPFRARWQALCHEQGIQVQTLLDAVKKTLADAKGRWILSPHAEAKNEWVLLCREGDQHKRYILDRTFVDEQGRRWVIDYKSSLDENTQSFLAEARAQHAAQLEAYAHALALKTREPIYCGLYFPRMAGWVEWVYVLEQEETVYG